MSAFALLGLLSVGLLMASVSSGGDDEVVEETDVPEPPEVDVEAEPEIAGEPEQPEGAVNGSDAADTIRAAAGQTVNGLQGDDTLLAGDQDLLDFSEQPDPVDGVTLNGGDGDDRIEAFGDDIALNGGAGDDTIFVRGSGDVQGGDGDDLIAFIPSADYDEVDVDGGNGNDTIYYESTTGAVRGGAGNDSIDVVGIGGGVFGDAGDDTISVVDEGGITRQIFGGAGDDLISTGSADVMATPTEIDAGEGNDTIISEYSTLRDEVAADTVTGGNGADTFGVLFFYPGEQAVDIGRALTITDFDKNEDVLILGNDDTQLDFAPHISDLVLEETDGGTNLRFTVEERFGDRTTYDAHVRLEGVTGLTLDEISIVANTDAA